MNKTMYLGVNLKDSFKQAVDNSQGLNFCVHIFERAKNDTVVSI